MAVYSFIHLKMKLNNFEKFNNIFIMFAIFLLTIFAILFPCAQKNAEANPHSDLNAGQENTSGKIQVDVIHKLKNLNMPFITNNGLVDEKVKFYANTFCGTVFVTKEGEIVYSMPARSPESTVKGKESLSRSPGFGVQGSDVKFQNEHSGIKNLAFKEELVRGTINEIRGEERGITKVSYFKGKDSSPWNADLPTYNVVNLGEVYKGIELRLKAHGNNVEKLFCIKPNAIPKMIKLKLSGAKALKVNENGQLEAETELGSVKFTKPIAYQEIDGKRAVVSVEYIIHEQEASQVPEFRRQKSALLNPKSKIQNPKLEYGFKVAAYDKTKDLIIDPLIASTYLGGSDDDYGSSIITDSENNIYVAGWTKSPDFPTTLGAYSTSYSRGNHDAFVSKLSKDLTNLLASTYLGGSSEDYISSITLATDGNVYVCGKTLSSDFPTTSNAYDNSYSGDSGNHDAFVSKLSGDLTSLLASTNFGGSGDDSAGSIKIDSSGNVYVFGKTLSSNFPVTTDAYDTSLNKENSYDVFVSKFSGDLSSLLASTYLGGSDYEYGFRLTIASDGNIYVTGQTWSSDFPTTSGAYNTSFQGVRDAFVSKLSADLTSLLASTYLGGSGSDDGYSIAIDSDGNIYVAGGTDSSDFPITTDTQNISMKGPADAFVSKLNGDLTSLSASTYLGGSNYERANSIAIDSSGNVYVAGSTNSSDFPTNTNTYYLSFKGDTDAFISKLSGNLVSLLASTCLGGSDFDRINAITLDPYENICIAGYTTSTDFPITTGAYNTTFHNNEGGDVFVTTFDHNFSTPITTPTATASPTPIPTPSQSKSHISGRVADIKGNPVESVKLDLEEKNSKTMNKTYSNENGLFEFADLEPDTYMLIARKKEYKKYERRINLKEGKVEDVEILLIKKKHYVRTYEIYSKRTSP
ncbi:MAG: SBBP repeat-containing protein [Candidatus Brocadiales bacterium]|nr:SBBP repeat-containing protein [Candidatus Brocadiales bacterium]